ncbi:MAG: tRNA 2-selenouridine(34) synthase MnmH [Bacteroidetes bacterium]|nr:tRNA 2-selenouridine(34) synthase MnmH [Bacteroidota bacterium]
MQVQVLPINDFLLQMGLKKPLLLDTRSEKEFEKAHLPGAISLPLLNNEQRHIIGTVYKKEGRQAAVLKGFELVGPEFHGKIKFVLKEAKDRQVFLYCWRGGMRSNIMAWLLKMAGLKVVLLEGGYKSFRHWIIEQLNRPLKILILGGKTGSGKTDLLKMMRSRGEQTIDLEQLASHKGSAFGLLGMPPQPMQEHFENLLGMEMHLMNETEIVWLENESRGIGKLIIPNTLFERMRLAKVVELEVSHRERMDRILKEYCIFPKESLAEHTRRIERRLGGQHMKAALAFLEEDQMEKWLEIILGYYDKTYAFSNEKRDQSQIHSLSFSWNEVESGLNNIIQSKNKFQAI